MLRGSLEGLTQGLPVLRLSWNEFVGLSGGATMRVAVGADGRGGITARRLADRQLSSNPTPSEPGIPNPGHFSFTSPRRSNGTLAWVSAALAEPCTAGEAHDPRDARDGEAHVRRQVGNASPVFESHAVAGKPHYAPGGLSTPCGGPDPIPGADRVRSSGMTRDTSGS